VPEIINRIVRFLYGQPAGQLIRLAQIYAVLPGLDEGEIGEALHRMRDQHLIESTFQNDAVRLVQDGRDAWNDGSIVQQTMGMQYVGTRYGNAAVHIVVTSNNGESGGSGFFSADYPGWIVTAAHVLRERDLVRILNRHGDILAVPPLQTLLHADTDLALLRCNCPGGVNPIRVEWRHDAIQPMERLLVLGYPAIPNLRPDLDHITAELRQVTRDFRGERESLVISSVTLPGSSGGPVLSRRGRAIGIVEQENIAERLGERTIHAFTATPARYLAELRLPNPVAGEEA